MESADKKTDNDVDILLLLAKCWKGRKWILTITGCFFVFGVFATVFSPHEYNSSVVFVPQSNQSLSSSYSYLASAMGLNMDLNLNDGPMTPRVYPHILDNVNFQLDLMNTPVCFSTIYRTMTLYDYFTDPSTRKFNLMGSIIKYTVGLPGLLMGKLKKDEDKAASSGSSSDTTEAITIPVLTKKQQSVATTLSRRVQMTVNPKEGYLEINVMMPDPMAAAQTCQASLDLLRKYLSEFKSENANQNLKYINEQYEIAKADYESKLYQYARFVDSNRAAMTATASIRKNHYQAEAELARQLYAELAKNLSTAKVKISEENLVLVDIKPVSIPDRKTKPNTMASIFIWTVLGLCVGCAKELLPDWWRKRKAATFGQPKDNDSEQPN